VEVVYKARIDPLPILDLTDCVQELRRRGIQLPERGPWDTDPIYLDMCQKVIKEDVFISSSSFTTNFLNLIFDRNLIFFFKKKG
jgi:hypothetical protein